MILRSRYLYLFGYNMEESTLVGWAVAGVYTSEESPRSKGKRAG